MRRFFLHIFLLTACFAHGMDRAGHYFVQNYSKAQYNAHSQNWSLHQDTTTGFIYSANSQGMLRFDGIRWRVFPLPNQMVVRSVRCDHEGRIYVGGFEEFGYFETRPNGMLNYVSLSDSLAVPLRNNEEIWKIHMEDESVYFQTFTTVYHYLPDSGVSEYRAPGILMFLLKKGDVLGVSFNDVGLHRFEEGRYSLMEGGPVFKDLPVLTWLQFGDKEIVGTALGGLFLKEGDAYEPWDTPASLFLKENQLNCGLVVSDSLCAFGTILDGLIMIDREGEIVEHLNMENGLQNNTVLSLHLDMEHDLWLGLDNGIDRVETSSPFRYFFDTTGRLGAVYDACRFGDYLYLGTNHGLFFYPIRGLNPLSPKNNELRLVEGTQGQVWQLKQIDGVLFCGHNDGSFVVRQPGGTAEKISDISGGWALERVSEAWYVQGTYIGLAFYKKGGRQNRQFSHRIKGFQQPVRYVAASGDDVIWASHNLKGVYKVVCTPGFDSAQQVKYYGREEGFPSDYNIHLFKIRERIVFTTAAGLYSYNELTDSVFLFEKLNRAIPEYSLAHRIVQESPAHWWFITAQKVGLVHIDPEFNASVVKEFIPRKGLRVEPNENIVNLGDKSAFILSGGVMFFSSHNDSMDGENLSRFNLNSVRRFGRKSRGSQLLSLKPKGPPELKSRFNNVSFIFSNAVYSSDDQGFQTRLAGFEEEWSFPETSGHRTFTNLPPGDYQFWVRLKNQPSTGTPLYRFSVANPWHHSWWAFLFYFLILAGAIVMAVKLQRLNLKRQKVEMELKQHEELEHQRLLAEKRIMTLENEKLENEIMHKSREISSSALELSGKNKLLSELKKEIELLRNRGNMEQAPFNRLLKLIDTNLKRRDEWKLFEANFNHMNSEFYKQLSAGYPDLTSKDLRFCAFLKMNLTTKELASLLNISARSVELRRYRLRKRLNLNHEDNLVEFLMGFEEHGSGLR